MDPQIVGGLTWSVPIGLVFGLIHLGIFARKEEIERLRAEIATNYVQKSDFDKRLDSIEAKLDRLIEKEHA